MKKLKVILIFHIYLNLIIKDKYTEQEGELIQLTNKALTITLEKSEEETKKLKEKLFKLKEYKNLFKNTTQFQCQNCQKLIPQNQYLEHSTKKLCENSRELINIYSSLNDMPENKSLNISNINNSRPIISIENESQLVPDDILYPLEENRQDSFKKKKKQRKYPDLMIHKQMEKKETLKDLIEKLANNEKYSILQAKKREMISPKGSINNISNYQSTLKKEQKKDKNLQLNSNRMLTLNWDNSENENPCSQRFESMNFLFKSMRNCDIIAKKTDEKNSMFMNQKNWNIIGK